MVRFAGFPSDERDSLAIKQAARRTYGVSVSSRGRGLKGQERPLAKQIPFENELFCDPKSAPLSVLGISLNR
jgi:hypothetical protein